MKNIESRVAKLEQLVPTNDFLIVIANKGESREQAINRTMHENKINNFLGYFVIYLNLHGNK